MHVLGGADVDDGAAAAVDPRVAEDVVARPAGTSAAEPASIVGLAAVSWTSVPPARAGAAQMLPAPGAAAPATQTSDQLDGQRAGAAEAAEVGAARVGGVDRVREREPVAGTARDAGDPAARRRGSR